MTKKPLKKVFQKFWKISSRQLHTTVVAHWPLLVASVVLAALLFRNPYNTRTLIPNFEPFPDSFHYVTVARCFLRQGEWKLCREGIQSHLEGAAPSVPQAYSLSLLPVFLLNSDPRSFYFTNVLLTFFSIVLLYGIVSKLSKQKLVQAFVLLTAVTSYHVYWLPTLAMAENVLVPLYLLSIWLFLQKKTPKQLVALGAVASAIYFTKYAYALISASILLFAALSSILAAYTQKAKTAKTLHSVLKDLVILTLPVVATIPFSHNFFNSFRFLISVLTPTTAAEATSASSTGGYFSLEMARVYAPKYLEILWGKPARFLWDVRPWYPSVLGLLGITGWVLGLLEKKHRFIAGFLVVSSVLQIGFMSTFYAFDSRYIYSGFFAVLLGLVLLFEYCKTNVAKISYLKKNRKVVLSVSFILFALLGTIVFAPRLIPLKSQVVINLKYAETPWWYLSILEYNTFFANKREEQPQLITLTSPFMIDYFTNNTYVVLPYDEQQDFASERATVWGIPSDESLVNTYTKKLAAGENLYLANYGKEGADRFRSTFMQYEEIFQITLEQEGCFNLCNIYSVSLKPSDM